MLVMAGPAHAENWYASLERLVENFQTVFPPEFLGVEGGALDGEVGALGGRGQERRWLVDRAVLSTVTCNLSTSYFE